ncbi:MAG: ABC transporter substrate-binding protein [Elusimicrobiota bacterium]|jgi:NitT/TauT family transport system substrate-binding protein|nr:ABC transporter substrate-binding protein [Elusimicrobiota bacterium]
MKCFKSLCLAALSVLTVLNSSAFAALDKAKYPYGEVEIPALSGAVCGATAYIAYEKKFFDEEGIKVKLTSGASFEVTRTALATGKIPVINGDFQYFPAVHNGVNVKLVGGIHEGCIKVLLPKNSKVKTAKDFKGKKIGVDEIGGTPMSVVSVILGNAGLNPSQDVKWVPYPNDQLVTAAEKGEIDVIAAWDPFATILEQKGYKVFSDLSTDPLFAGKFCCFLFASGKLVDQKPEQIAAILRAYYKSTKWIGQNTEEAAKIILEKKYIPVEGTEDDLKLITGLLKHYKHGQTHGLPKEQAKRDALYFAQELTKTGYLPKDLDAQKFIDNLYVDIEELAKSKGSKKKK